MSDDPLLMPCCPALNESCCNWEGGMGVLNTGTDPDSLLPGIGVNSGLE